MKKIILTGFGPFGPYKKNPTEILAQKFNGQFESDFLIQSHVLSASMEVVWGFHDGVSPIIRAIDDVVAIISFGIASTVRRFRVESAFINWVESKYCRQGESGNMVFVERPIRETFRLDLSHWDFGLMRQCFADRGIPMEAEFSNDAGTFFCNAFAYRLCLALQGIEKPPPFLFLHTPCTPECIVGIPDWDFSKTLISQEQLEDGFRIILSCLR